MRSWRGFDTSPTMMRVSSFASCIILPVSLKLKTLPNIPYQEAACTHDICHAHNTRNFTKPSDTLTYDICHGQIRRDFTSDKFFPGLYSNAKAHIAKGIGTILWLLRVSKKESPQAALRPAAGTCKGARAMRSVCIHTRRTCHERFSPGTRAETGASRRYRFPGAAAFRS